MKQENVFENMKLNKSEIVKRRVGEIRLFSVGERVIGKHSQEIATKEGTQRNLKEPRFPVSEVVR